MPTIWKARAINQAGEELNQFFPELISRFLISRGFNTKTEVDQILNSKLSELKDPMLMRDLDLAVKRIVQAFKKKEQICIYADFDLDGTSGLALLGKGLQALGFEHLVHFQPLRLAEGYGFHAHIVEALAEQGVKLIITVDVGITAFEACEKAESLGVDVIITDHHQPKETLPKALAVVNPNRTDDKSGLGYLSGAGVAFYLLRAIKRALVDEALIAETTFNLKSVLDYLTIATLTDMVPLVDDNRVLVRHGLVQLQNTDKPGLRALLESLSLGGRPLSSQDVAIRFAPKLNALSRMEMGTRPLDLMLVDSETKARDLVKTVMSNNNTRVQLQSEGEDKALSMLATWPHEKFVFLFSEDFHKGVVGLIATKISQLKNVPTWIGSLSEDGSITGSARLPSGYSGSLLTAMANAQGVWNRFGGHDAAAGFEVPKDRAVEVIDRLAQFFLSADEKDSVYEVLYDLEVGLSDLNEAFMRWLESLGPYGQSFEVPSFKIKDLVLKDIYSLRGGHLKFRFEDETGLIKRDALYFSPPKELEPGSFAKSGRYDVLGELQWNYFNGSKDLQILVRDIRSAGNHQRSGMRT